MKINFKRAQLLFWLGIAVPAILYPLTVPTTNAANVRFAFATKGIEYSISLNDLIIRIGPGGPEIFYKYILSIGLLSAFIGSWFMFSEIIKKRK